MKVTEPGLNTLIDNLNTLICEDSLLTRKERETLVLAVAAIGAMKARVGMKKPTVPAASKPKEEKQAPVPDPRFPNARQAWMAEEENLLLDALDGIPNDDIGKHLSINVVTCNKPKMLTGLHQKVRGMVVPVRNGNTWTITPPADRQNLTRSSVCWSELGKPVLPP